MKVTEQENPEPKKEETTNNVSMSKEDYDNLMKLAETTSQLASKLEKLEKEKSTGGLSAQDVERIVRASNGEPDAPLREEDIDPNDYLDDVNAVTFFAPNAGFAIADDIRHNRTVKTPYNNVIWFEFAGEEIDGTGKNTQYNIISQYVCHSKKEAEWLKSHRFFNILFFESQDEALSIDGRVFAELYKTMNYVRGLEPGEVHQQLLSAGKNPSNNTENNRRILSLHFAKQKVDEISKTNKRTEMPIYARNGGGLNEIEEALLSAKKPVESE